MKLPYKYTKNQFPHQRLRKSPEWKQKRQQLMEKKGGRCEWCFGKKNLQISHAPKKHLDYYKYKYIFEKLMHERGLLYADVFKGEYPELLESYNKEVNAQCEEYMNIVANGILLLCRRCHYSRDKNLILCSNCGENYHKKNYEMCMKCHKRELKKKK